MHNSTNYPPYNLVEVSEDTYMIELALAGFKKEDIAIEQEKNVLTIKGSSVEDSNKYIHKESVQETLLEHSLYLSIWL
jgi:molecular chaperone IbpA